MTRITIENSMKRNYTDLESENRKNIVSLYFERMNLICKNGE